MSPEAAALEEDERRQNEQLPTVYPRLGVLDQPKAEISALLMQSIQSTHGDVLAFEDIESQRHAGVRIVSGRFRHRATGAVYLITVSKVGGA